ncbi:MAG: hypothetical protein IKK41_01625 [Oscillospiraceae bacterium]|nr:hypothetical protein [Oscillospiraceae bacterium]
MKKLISLLLVLVMVAAMAAGCGQKDGNTDTTATTAATTEATTAPTETTETTESFEDITVATQPAAEPGTALAVLQDVWALFGENEKFFAYGGDGANMVDGAPGAYTDMEALTVQLLVPASQQANVTEIASLFHGMMVNNFTCGAFKLAEGVDAAAFADTLYNAAKNNQWMCGMPEKVMVAVVDDIVVLVFGLSDVLDTFEANLAEAYPNAEVKYSEAIA